MRRDKSCRRWRRLADLTKLKRKLIPMPVSKIENTAEFQADASDSVSSSRVPRSRIIRFVTVILSVLLAANWFVCATWNHFSGMVAVPAWEIIPPGLTLAFVAATFLALRYSNFGLRLAYRISVVWLGVLNFSFFAACAAWIV